MCRKNGGGRVRITPWQRPCAGVDVPGVEPFAGGMNQDEQEPPASQAGLASPHEVEASARVVRHRRHQFPARDRVVKVRYDDREHAVLAAAADRAGLTIAGFLAGAGLSVAGEGPPPSQAADRELLAELLRLRLSIRRYAVNVNQAVAALHSSGSAPVWLSQAIAGAHQAVLSADDATRRVAGRPG